MSYFVYKLIPLRPTFPGDASEAETEQHVRDLGMADPAVRFF